MVDLIDRQDLLKNLNRFAPEKYDALVNDIIKKQPTIEVKPRWIPCSERLPEEDHWLGGSGRQFSDEVLVSVVNYDDEDTWVYISQTIDGKWALELPRHCEITAWRPLPEPYRGGEE